MRGWEFLCFLDLFIPLPVDKPSAVSQYSASSTRILLIKVANSTGLRLTGNWIWSVFVLSVGTLEPGQITNLCRFKSNTEFIQKASWFVPKVKKLINKWIITYRYFFFFLPTTNNYECWMTGSLKMILLPLKYLVRNKILSFLICI